MMSLPLALARLRAQTKPAGRKPGGALRQQSRVVRGGSWNNDHPNLRAAYRNHNPTDNRNNNLGCRLCVLPHLIVLPIGCGRGLAVQHRAPFRFPRGPWRSSTKVCDPRQIGIQGAEWSRPRRREPTGQRVKNGRFLGLGPEAPIYLVTGCLAYAVEKNVGWVSDSVTQQNQKIVGMRYAFPTYIRVFCNTFY
jgi:hypothetical protein